MAAAPPPGRGTITLHHLLSRVGLIVALALLLLAVLAWGWLWLTSMGDQSMDGAAMDMPMDGMAMEVVPWSPAYLFTAFAMWTVMMVAMMVPSAAPMILLHARIDRAETEGARLLNSGLFLAAYLLVWTGFALAATAAQAALLHGGFISVVSLALGSRWAIILLLLLAAAYELTPAKQRCLENCQSPLIFLHRYWKQGPAGAFRVGFLHGLYCLGCCWALMLLLFAGGVMNLALIALLAILVVAEKVAPPHWKAHRAVAAVLLAGALLIAVRP